MTILCPAHRELHTRSCQSCAVELGGELTRTAQGDVHCACGLPGEIQIIHDGVTFHIYRCTGCGLHAELPAPNMRWSETHQRWRLRSLVEAFG